MEWTSLEDDQPAEGEPAFLWDAALGAMWIGCRTFADDSDPPGWVWCNSYGNVWLQGDKWECDAMWDDDYTPTHFCRFPPVPTMPKPQERQ